MAEELLDDGQGRAALDLAQGPAVPEAVRVHALLDPGLGCELLAEGPDVGIPRPTRVGSSLTLPWKMPLSGTRRTTDRVQWPRHSHSRKRSDQNASRCHSLQSWS